MVKVSKTVYVEYAHIYFIEHEFHVNFSEWVRLAAAKAFENGTQNTINIIIPDTGCSCGETWEYAKHGVMCPKCGNVGKVLK